MSFEEIAKGTNHNFIVLSFAYIFYGLGEEAIRDILRHSKMDEKHIEKFFIAMDVFVEIFKAEEPEIYNFFKRLENFEDVEPNFLVKVFETIYPKNNQSLTDEKIKSKE